MPDESQPGAGQPGGVPVGPEAGGAASAAAPSDSRIYGETARVDQIVGISFLLTELDQQSGLKDPKD